MFYIVESDLQLQRLRTYKDKPCYIEAIPSNFYFHPKLTSTTALYIRPLDFSKGYIIPIDNEEGLNVDKTRVYDILKEYGSLYTTNRKNLLYHFNLLNSKDISLLYSMTEYDRLELPDYNRTIHNFYNKFENNKNINKIIPISKIYEHYENVFDKILPVTKYKVPSGYDFYNTTATNVFYLIEQQGLGIIYNAFVDLFNPRNPIFNIKDNKVLTSYNLYNATSRPTNSYNSINFAAIPHNDSHRRTFTPQNDYFVEFDFDGYHLRLLCDQINYPLTVESAHKQLAKHYFGTEDITEDQYKEAKQINFHAIYGKIPKKHKNLEVFKLIKQYIDSLWSNFEGKGMILDPISNKPFTEQLKRMNPAKLMNYSMQSLETSRNILILKEVLRFLKDKKTKIALYTYDSVLFDFSKEEKNILEDLENVLSEDGKYPVKFKFSENLVL